MPKYWCVNFEDTANLEFGIENRLWAMGYQYADDGNDSPPRKAAITRNWRTLEEVTAGDQFVAYLRGKGFFAVGKVAVPRRTKTSRDRADTIEEYLKRGKRYHKGHVYFSPSVVYENLTDVDGDYPVRIDVERWESHVPDGVSIDGLDFPRHKTVNAAFEIDKNDFDKIRGALAGEDVQPVIPEEVDSPEQYFEGAVKTITVNAYERSREARSKCIQHHGWKCGVCGYAMADLYGTLGERVIHVHHLRELANLGEQYEVDPIKDLRPVCPNCHAILHTSSPAMSITQLRKVLSKCKPIRWPAKS